VHPESVSGGKNVLMGPFDPVMLGQVSIAIESFMIQKKEAPSNAMNVFCQ
jgi:hypothetical protein